MTDLNVDTSPTPDPYEGSPSAPGSSRIRKSIFAALGLVLLATSGMSFYRHRHMEEPVVLSPGVTEVKKLSDYWDGMAGSINDCNVYILEGEGPGATLFVMGGRRPAWRPGFWRRTPSWRPDGSSWS